MRWLRETAYLFLVGASIAVFATFEQGEKSERSLFPAVPSVGDAERVKGSAFRRDCIIVSYGSLCRHGSCAHSIPYQIVKLDARPERPYIVATEFGESGVQDRSSEISRSVSEALISKLDGIGLAELSDEYGTIGVDALELDYGVFLSVKNYDGTGRLGAIGRKQKEMIGVEIVEAVFECNEVRQLVRSLPGARPARCSMR